MQINVILLTSIIAMYVLLQKTVINMPNNIEIKNTNTEEWTGSSH